MGLISSASLSTTSPSSIGGVLIRHCYAVTVVTVVTVLEKGIPTPKISSIYYIYYNIYNI